MPKITSLEEVTELGTLLRQDDAGAVALRTLESIFQDAFSSMGAQACMLIGLGVLTKEQVVGNLERLIEVVEAV